MSSSDAVSGSISTRYGFRFFHYHQTENNELYECVLAGETLHVLNRGHVDDPVVRYTPVFLCVDHWLEVLVDRGIELFQFLVLTDGTKSAETAFDRRIVVRHGLRFFEGCEVLTFLEREHGEIEGTFADVNLSTTSKM